MCFLLFPRRSIASCSLSSSNYLQRSIKQRGILCHRDRRLLQAKRELRREVELTWLHLLLLLLLLSLIKLVSSFRREQHNRLSWVFVLSSWLLVDRHYRITGRSDVPNRLLVSEHFSAFVWFNVIELSCFYLLLLLLLRLLCDSLFHYRLPFPLRVRSTHRSVVMMLLLLIVSEDILIDGLTVMTHLLLLLLHNRRRCLRSDSLRDPSNCVTQGIQWAANVFILLRLRVVSMRWRRRRRLTGDGQTLFHCIIV